MKAGTTSVADALATHPDAYVCPIKEPNFFCSDLYAQGLGSTGMGIERVMQLVRKGKRLHHAYVRERGTYESLFDDSRGQRVIADLSTNYLYSHDAAANISAASPGAKILIILRNPVERAFSEFVMNCSIGVARPPFGDWLDREQDILATGRLPVEHRYVSAGLYHGQVKRYLDAFPKDQVRIVLFDDLKRDFNAVMAGVADFLGIRPFAGDAVVSNASIYPRMVRLNRIAELFGAKRLAREWLPDSLKEFIRNRYYRNKPTQLELSEQDASRLRQSFSDDIARLSELIGRDLGGWHGQ